MNNNKSPRKVYAKPLIAVEDFAFNQFIASCAVKTGRPGNVNPGWRDDLQDLNPLIYAQVMATGQFIDGIGCTKHADDDGMDTLCYHTSTSPLFTS